MQDKFESYLQKNSFDRFDIKAFLIDMDGVLYDSMPSHCRSWNETFRRWNILGTNEDEFYLHEGRVGSSTIQLIFERELNRKPTEEETKKIYNLKSSLFRKYNSGKTISFATELLQKIKSENYIPVLVTGSGQTSLLDKLNENFPNIFTPETMVTAKDVKHGKPNPEPYLRGLQKAGNLSPNQAIVIENAPIGVESAHKADVFVIAVNTGPFDDNFLYEAGADIVLPSMESFFYSFSTLQNYWK